ncbi:MAG: hypothetical protein IPL51_06660 [Candidatus Competibacteraceae bacterium]|nr:hypothetical protein [Candidatus Competibacteraceae bacterium]
MNDTLERIYSIAAGYVSGVDCFDLQESGYFLAGCIAALRAGERLDETFLRALEGVAGQMIGEAEATERLFQLASPKKGDLLLLRKAVDPVNTAWQAAYMNVMRHLERGQSVNLAAGPATDWRALVSQVGRCIAKNAADWVWVDLNDPATKTRQGLLRKVAQGWGASDGLSEDLDDLANFAALLKERARPYLALTNFDLVAGRDGYDEEFFSALHTLVCDQKRVTLLVQSNQPLAGGALISTQHCDYFETVKLECFLNSRTTDS